MLGGATPLEEHRLTRDEHHSGRLQPPQGRVVIDGVSRRNGIHHHKHVPPGSEQIEGGLGHADMGLKPSQNDRWHSGCNRGIERPTARAMITFRSHIGAQSVNPY